VKGRHFTAVIPIQPEREPPPELTLPSCALAIDVTLSFR
jgi:hypothetical protein